MLNSDQIEYINYLLGLAWIGTILSTDYTNVGVDIWTNTELLILWKYVQTWNRRAYDKLCPLLTIDFKVIC